MENLREHLRPTAGRNLTLDEVSQTYDAYCTQWHDGTRTPWNADYLIKALGICLGDQIIALRPAARWCHASQLEQSTIAVRLDQQRRTVFPVDAVTRRWQAARIGWMTEWVTNLVD